MAIRSGCNFYADQQYARAFVTLSDPVFRTLHDPLWPVECTTNVDHLLCSLSDYAAHRAEPIDRVLPRTSLSDEYCRTTVYAPRRPSYETRP